MEENVDLKVVVQVQEAERNLEKVVQKAQEAKEKVKDLNDKTQEGIPAIKGLGQSFETALGKADGSMKGLISSITGTIKGIKGFAPAFKAARVAGDSLWKSIKVGIASTGIGLLVVALGEVIGNWDKWSSTIQSWLPWARKSQEETDALREATNRLVVETDSQNKEINNQVRLMRAQGVEEETIILWKYQETKALRANIEAQIAETNAKINSIKAHSAFRRWIMGEDKALEGLTETLETLEKKNDQLLQTQYDTLWDLKVLRAETARKRLEEEEKAATDAAKKGAEERKKIAEEEAKERAEAVKKYVNEFIKAVETAENQIDKINQDFENEGLPDFIQKWSSGELFRDPELGRALAERVAEIQVNVDKETAVFDDAIQKRIAQQQTLTEMIAKIESGEEQVPAGVTLQELKDNLELQKNELQKYYDYRAIIVEKGTKEQTEAYEKGLLEREKLDLEYQEKQQELDYKFAKESLQNLPDKEKHQKEYELEQQRLQEHQEYLQKLLEMETVGTEEYKKLMLEIEEANYNVASSESKRAEQIKKDVEDEVLAVNASVQSIGDLMGSLSDFWEADLQAREADIKKQLEEGKIGKELAEEQLKQIDEEYERMKALQYTETVLNTIAGAVGAFLQASKAYAPPYGQIIGAATAATVTAAGLAELIKIKNTSFGASGGLGGGISAPNVGVTPIDVKDDIKVSPTTLAQSQSPADQRVYILEGDIQDSNKRVEIREANSTF